MFIGANGKTFFNDMGELFYNLFLEIGLGINQDQYIYDQDSGIVLKCKDRYIKASINNTPVYAGKNDIVFDPANNYNLIVWLLSYYAEKEEANGEGNVSYMSHFTEPEVYISRKTDRDTTKRYRQRVVIVTRSGQNLHTGFYYNLYLAFIEAIFILSGNDEYDLSNFDVVPEM